MFKSVPSSPQIMFGLPIVSIPFMIYFPAALGVYWVTNNFISLGQVMIPSYLHP